MTGVSTSYGMSEFAKPSKAVSQTTLTIALQPKNRVKLFSTWAVHADHQLCFQNQVTYFLNTFIP